MLHQYKSNSFSSLLITFCVLISIVACSEKALESPNSDLRASLRRPASNSSVAHGKVLYDYYCAGCHGDDGLGNGPDTLDEENPAPEIFSKSTLSGDAPQLKCTSDFAAMQYHGQLEQNEVVEMASYLNTLRP